MNNERPGLSNEKYYSLPENERNIFDLVVSKPSGTNKEEIKEKLGLTYSEIKAAVMGLINKNVAVNAYEGSSGVYLTLQYSPYAEDYNKWIYDQKISEGEDGEMSKLPWEVVEEKTWEAVVQYIEKRMSANRQSYGKYYKGNWELWRLKRAMQEVDPTITNVGETFDKHENAGYDVRQ